MGDEPDGRGSAGSHAEDPSIGTGTRAGVDQVVAGSTPSPDGRAGRRTQQGGRSGIRRLVASDVPATSRAGVSSGARLSCPGPGWAGRTAVSPLAPRTVWRPGSPCTARVSVRTVRISTSSCPPCICKALVRQLPQAAYDVNGCAARSGPHGGSAPGGPVDADVPATEPSDGQAQRSRTTVTNSGERVAVSVSRGRNGRSKDTSRCGTCPDTAIATPVAYGPSSSTRRYAACRTSSPPAPRPGRAAPPARAGRGR